MTTTRDDAPSSVPDAVGEASTFPAVRGIRWWAVLLLALALTAGGVAADVLRTGTLDAIFLAAYPGGCVLATLLVQRRDLFVAMVQPPLLLAVSVPVAVAATGTLPASGGLTSTALAVGAPLINGFPAMAVTTVVCVVIGVVRIRVQRWHRSGDDARPEPVRAGPPDGAARDRGDAPARDRPTPKRDDRDRREPPRSGREQAERDRRRSQERARAERDRAPDRDRDRDRGERDRAERDRRERDRPERDRPERDRPERDRPRDDAPRKEPSRAEAERRPAAQRSSPPPGQPAQRSPIPPERGGPEPAQRSPIPPERGGPDPAPKRPPRDTPPGPRSREDRMREERLREERRQPGPPPGVHPVRRPDDRP